MVANWRLIFATTYNDKTIDAFDASIQRVERLIGKSGQLQATISIPNENVGRRLKRIIGQEGRLSMYAYRGTALWWGGFLDSTRIESSNGETVLVVAGSSYETYLTRRETRNSQTLTQDQLQFAKWAWDEVQSGGIETDVRVDTSNVGTCGVNRTVTWKLSDVVTYDNVLTEASNQDDGFEWMIDVSDDGSQRHRTLHVGYPRINRPTTNYVVSMPGSILGYAIEGNAVDGATSFQARGKAPNPVGVPGKKGNVDGTGGGGKASAAQDPIMSNVYQADSLHAQGFTRIDATVDRPLVTDMNILNLWAQAARNLRSGPLVLPEVTCRIDGLDGGVIGARILIRIRDAAFPAGPTGEPGYEAYARVIGIEIDPGEQGYDDTVKLTFEDPHSDYLLQGEIPANATIPKFRGRPTG